MGYRRKSRKTRRGRRKVKSWNNKKTLGFNIGSNNVVEAVTAAVLPTGGNLNSRTVYAADVTNLNESTVGDNNLRWGNQVDCRGIKYYFSIINKKNVPIVFHVALVTLQDQSEKLLSGLVIVSDHFRDATQEKRAIDFDASRTGLTMNKYPLNPDKYKIWKHSRFLIGAQNGQTNVAYATNRPSFLEYKSYVPIKRQLRYAGTSGADCLNNIQLIYWCDQIGALSNDQFVIGHCDVALYAHMCFRRPK